MEQILATLYPLAAQIATPMALAGTLSLLLFFFFGAIIKMARKPIELLSGEFTFKILMAMIGGGLLLALVAIVGALLLYGAQFSYETIYRKVALINSGYAELDNQSSDGAAAIAESILVSWPNEPAGFNIRGAARFQQRRFSDAVSDFRHLLNSHYAYEEPCDTRRLAVTQNLIASLGAAKQIKEALDFFDQIKACNVGKDAVINHAKLLMVSDQDAQAAERLQSINNDVRPNYRDRISFELGILAIKMKRANWMEQAVLHLSTSGCQSEGFKRLIENGTVSNSIDPPGGMIQDFSYELDIMRNRLNAEERAELAAQLASSKCPTEPGALKS